MRWPVTFLWVSATALGGIQAALAGVADVGAYDAALCEQAQRLIVNAGGVGEPAPFTITVLRGEGNGFHTIQMDVDVTARKVVIATTTVMAEAGGERFPAYVACKMVDRDRINGVLGTTLAGPERSCRDVNEFTHEQALSSLSAAERTRYEAAGRPLRFNADYVAATGGEWLPVAADAFIRPAGTVSTPGKGLEVSAPSVRVPWNDAQRSFFQGTHHCKLITLATMRRWMLSGAVSGATALFPPSKPACIAPAAIRPRVGSCLFYFAPADSMFCEDYSGSGWTRESAQAECAKRHASAEALRQAANRYSGAGGLFSASACASRPDAPAVSGTCVFHCGRPDETLWHPSASASAGPGAAAMMNRACDLFIE